MAATWGRKLRLTIFGESHGPAIGIVVDGLPPGEAIDPDFIAWEMSRRRPGGSPLSTARSEADDVEILSGVQGGVTTGAPVCGLIRNQDARSGDYNSVLRPGHADWSALLKYHGHADMRGGGAFSGRMTAPLVFAGALAKQLLGRRGVTIGARIVQIGTLRDNAALPCHTEAWQALPANFPVADSAVGERMRAEILSAKQDGDSVGGVIEAVAFGMPGGVGEPFFASVESVLASLLFSIPAVKGVEFGDGFAIAGLRGSEANDPLYLDKGKILASSNHNGGILGGIATGMPIVVRAAFKPTPTIAKAQRSIDAATMRDVTLESKGRHDPCIVPRAVPVVESALALCLLDLMLESGVLP